jgi:hypothetical protein
MTHNLKLYYLISNGGLGALAAVLNLYVVGR